MLLDEIGLNCEQQSPSPISWPCLGRGAKTKQILLITNHQRFFVYFRRRRRNWFCTMFHPTERTRLLDIGGAPNTWLAEARHDFRFPVTLVNLRFPDPDARADSRFTPVDGDTTDLPFAGASFDIAFSNSVIEHTQRTCFRGTRLLLDRFPSVPGDSSSPKSSHPLQG